MRPRIFFGLRLGRNFRIRPYAGVGWSWRPGKRQALHLPVTVYHCSFCHALNRPDAKFCQKCGARFTAP
jgi:hypothetical protein